jgi:pimeloyl-ACP methyl ester carboxylesterase
LGEARFIARHVQQGAVGMIAGAAHLAPVEQPGSVAAALLEFFMMTGRKGTQ